jgi:hypothetical protein
MQHKKNEEELNDNLNVHGESAAKYTVGSRWMLMLPPAKELTATGKNKTFCREVQQNSSLILSAVTNHLFTRQNVIGNKLTAVVSLNTCGVLCLCDTSTVFVFWYKYAGQTMYVWRNNEECSLLQWKSSEYYTTWVWVCSLCYPAYKAHAPYCHLWSARLYNIFPHFISQTARFLEKKTLLNIKCVLVFSTTLTWNIFYSKKKWKILSKSYVGLHAKYPSFVSDFNDVWIARTDFRKMLKFHKNPSTGPRLKDGRADMTKLIIAYRNF